MPNLRTYKLSLNCGGYAASSINMVYPVAGNFLTYLNPPSYSQIYMETSDTGSGLITSCRTAVTCRIKKLLDIGYNGDPHMLWLFDGGNSSPNPPVWTYDSTKIKILLMPVLDFQALTYAL